ncbi:MAG: UDP-glucose/GDP-mannose dehydrogenase family protein [Patescibacteria group bacterium]|nr:UDP-glucose/GDP-mannose dehydrogenase family protein [Patescibacteria group bacterium]
MKITVIGTGYVGLVSGACLAELGNIVTCLDVQSEKIAKLKEGIMPIYEPGLDSVVLRNVQAGRLFFTDSYEDAILGAELISIAVGTPSADDGSVDMQYIEAAARDIGAHITEYTVIADKSTVPVGTAEKVEAIIREVSGVQVDVISNPEFLREGHAVYDFLHPARIIIGTTADDAKDRMLQAYEHVDCPKLVMDRRSAELTKYAANSFLATKISFINEMAVLAEEVGADISDVALGIGSDPRIGKDFLKAGPGWGGSCFPKDVRAMRHLAKQKGVPLPVVNAAHELNEQARIRMAKRLEEKLGSLDQKKIAILGLAFKGNTDDTRESASIEIIKYLLNHGATVIAHDPVAVVAPNDLDGYELAHIDCPYKASEGAHAVIVATEWEQFRTIDLLKLRKSSAGDLLVDTRNLFDPARAKEAGWQYLSIGRK